MNFFDFLGLLLNNVYKIFNLPLLSEDVGETHYYVTLGGFLVGTFLLGLIFKNIWTLSGLFGISAPTKKDNDTSERRSPRKAAASGSSGQKDSGRSAGSSVHRSAAGGS